MLDVSFDQKFDVNDERILASIEWNEKEHVAGAMLGESLTIDCGASGEPQPEIEITDADGEPLKGHFI